ncbi:MAG: acyltransferase [Rhizomicrobium sp.]
MIGYIDFLRFFAAFLVVFAHCRLQVFGQLKNSQMHTSAPTRLVSLLGSYGHSAVIVFFVVSGFLVGGKLINTKTLDARFVRSYAVDRASRIYTVSIPASLLAFSLAVGQIYFYGHAFSVSGVDCQVSWIDIVGTTFFVHKGIWAGHACNGPFWSLDYEVFYYVWFAALAVAVKASVRQLQIGGWIGFVILTLYVITEPSLAILGYSAIWALGALVAYDEKASFKRRCLGYTFVTLAYVGYCLWARDKQVWQDGVVAIVVAISLSVARILANRGVVVHYRLASLFSAGAAISYSLYLFHAPVIDTVRAVATMGFGWQPLQGHGDLYRLAAFLVFCAIAVAAGMVAWLLFERQTGVIRQRLKNAFVGPRTPYEGTKPADA